MSDLSPPLGILDDIETARTRTLVSRLLQVVRHSFVSVNSQTATPAAAEAWCATWLRHIHAAGLQVSDVQAGMANLFRWPAGEPFSFPTFARLCRAGGDADDRRELDEARSAYANREFSGLSPATWQAGSVLGFARVFNADGVTEAGWAAALLDARRAPSPAILARQPAGAALQIAQSPDARAAARTRNRAALDAALNAIPANLRPRRFSAPE